MIGISYRGIAMWDVVVIGAGLSGLTAARQLHEFGYTVLVVDKSRGLGGRLATRRVNEQPIDHGCRFLQPGLANDFSLLDDLLAAQIIQPWRPQVLTLNQRDQIVAAPHAETYYISPAGMNTVAKALAEGLLIQRPCQVTDVLPIPNGWQIKAETTPANAEPIQARAVVMAIPAPQILPILESAQAQLPALTEWLNQIEPVQFDPVITVMAGYAPDTDTRPNFQASGPDGWMFSGHDTSIVRWAALDSSKRPRAETPVVVVHSGPQFAALFLAAQILEPAGQELLDAASEKLGDWLKTPAWKQVHRWRYGFVTVPSGSNVVSAKAVPTLVGCGDWCGGYDAQAAVASGQAAAEKLVQALS